ncbi:MAG: insulinase family protein [Legionellales bacterium]|nr:insulinase family protein [Legionellales bacterium]
MGLFLLNLAIADHAVKHYQLKNGLQIFVKQDTRAPVVVAMVWYKVGGAYEYRGLTGISHALEHMMFKGTQKYGPGVVSRMIAEKGGQENAFTAQDYTAYFQELSADQLPFSFEIEADRMQHLTLAANEFVKEIQVVKEERYMRTDDNPQALTLERFYAAAYLDNPYHNPVVGWQNDLDNLTVENLRDWYHAYYGPNNAIIVVVGNVKPDDVFALAKKYYSSLKPIQVPTLKPVVTPPNLGSRTVNVEAPAKLPWVILGFNVPVVKNAKTTWEPYALDVLTGILDGGDSARLQTMLVRKNQVASDAGAAYSPFSLFPNLFILEGTPAEGHTIPDVKNALLDQIKQLQTQQVSQAELDRVKAQVIAQKTFDKDSIMGQAMQIGALEAVGLSYQLGDDYVKNIQAVTPQQIQAVAKKYLISTRETTAILHPLPLNSSPKSSLIPAVEGAAHVR